MNPIAILLPVSCLTVFALDAMGSVASRRFNFNYARLAPLSFITYAAVGFIGTMEADQTAGLIAAAAVGFFDATIGWKTSMLLKANTGKFVNNPTTAKWASTALVVTVFAAICGLIGSEIFRVLH